MEVQKHVSSRGGTLARERVRILLHRRELFTRFPCSMKQRLYPARSIKRQSHQSGGAGSTESAYYLCAVLSQSHPYNFPLGTEIHEPRKEVVHYVSYLTSTSLSYRLTFSKLQLCHLPSSTTIDSSFSKQGLERRCLYSSISQSLESIALRVRKMPCPLNQLFTLVTHIFCLS
jgi:hypothetical protein